jgi:putative phosphonate metabolism protein
MRYAIYFTPPAGDPLSKVAANWLGRNAFSGQAVKPPAIRSFEPEEVARLTEEPRRYGFHATLKAPFRLHEDFTERDLLSALMHFASSVAPVTIPRLHVTPIGPFFALTPEEPLPELDQLANDTVVALDKFRAPMTEKERAKRKPESLTNSQLRNLDRWGYPYVFDDFRFHMTLTGRVEEKDRLRVARMLDAFFEPVLSEPVEINNLALFVEPEPGAPFEVHSLHPLAHSSMTGAGAAKKSA